MHLGQTCRYFGFLVNSAKLVSQPLGISAIFFTSTLQRQHFMQDAFATRLTGARLGEIDGSLGRAGPLALGFMPIYALYLSFGRESNPLSSGCNRKPSHLATEAYVTLVGIEPDVA